MGELPGFHAVPEELHAASAQLRQVGGQARADLSRLVSEIDALLDGGWRGQATAGFERGWAQWFAGAGEMLDGLEAMAQLLGATGQGYSCAEDDSARVLAGADGRR